MNWRTIRSLRILDWDIENRPLSYWIPDRPSAEITAIAWSWIGEEEVHCFTLEPPPEHQSSMAVMLRAFRAAYDEADIVTGHYIRRHDLPITNGAMLENGLPGLTEKLTHDTKLDLTRFKDLPASQENLAELLGLRYGKEHMSQQEWREANRLSPAGVEETRRRVIGDVQQHKALRAELMKRGWLKPPSLWRP